MLTCLNIYLFVFKNTLETQIDSTKVIQQQPLTRQPELRPIGNLSIRNLYFLT